MIVRSHVRAAKRVARNPWYRALCALMLLPAISMETAPLAAMAFFMALGIYGGAVVWETVHDESLDPPPLPNLWLDGRGTDPF